MRRITLVAVAVAVGAAAACTTATQDFTGPACTAIQLSQNANNYSNCLNQDSLNGSGGGGGGGGSSNGAAPGLFKLITANGAALPFYLDSDSIATNDSTHVKVFALDSSILSLNTDSSVLQYDYYHIRDVRNAFLGPKFTYIRPLVVDTSVGAWSVTTGLGELITYGAGSRVSTQQFNFLADSLYGPVDCTFTDSVGTLDVCSATDFTYKRRGTALQQRVLPLHPAATVGHARPSSTSLSGVRGSDRGGRLGGVIGQ